MRPAWWLAATGSAIVLLLHLPSFVHRLMDGDEAVYGSIAALMNTGGRLYAEGGVDNKPPGIFWTYAATFEVFGRYQMTAVHALALLFVVGTCVVLVLIGTEIECRRAGLVAGALYGVLTAGGNPRLLAANTEVFMTLPLTAAFLLMMRRRWLWSGLLMVAAGAFKQVAVVEVLLVPAGLLLLEAPGSRMRAFLRFAAGIAIGLAAGAVLLGLTGSFEGFWRWTIQTLVGYASSNWNTGLLWSRSQDSLLPFVLYGAVAWVAAIALVARWRRLRPLERLSVVWFCLSLAGSLVAGHWSWHYFIQAMAPLSLLAALSIERLLQLQWRRMRLVAAVLTLGVLAPALYWFAFDLRADPLTYDWSPPIAQHELVAAYIESHTSPSDRVFVWGVWPALYVESDRLMAGRFPGFLRGFARASGLPPNNWDTAPDVWPELQSDLERDPPALIVDTSTAGWSDFAHYPMSDDPLLAALVSAKYREVATVDGVAIYARVA